MRVIASRRSALGPAPLLVVAALAMLACGSGTSPAPQPPGSGDASPAPGGGDGAPGGGTPNDPCAGLAPTFAGEVEQEFDTGTHSACSLATTNPSGQVALGISGSFAGWSGTVFRLYSPDGSASLGEIDGFLQQVFFTEDIDPWFHWTSSGYQGIVHPGDTTPVPFRTWDSKGQLVRDIEQYAVSSAPDRQGGSMLLARVFDPSGVATPLGPTLLEWVDASGQITRAVTLDRDPSLVLSNWATGHAVVVVPGSPGSARWFDEGGSAITPWFDIGSVSTRSMSLHVLLDGTVVIRNEGQWQLALPDGAASVGTVPGWLASRELTRLATIRQGRAYAVLPGGSSSDATRFEIIAGSGQSCGFFSIPPAAVRPGEAQSPRRLDVGQDGTLLQTSSVVLTPDPGGIHCAFRWWPELLR